jgi:hypothetical protein
MGLSSDIRLRIAIDLMEMTFIARCCGRWLQRWAGLGKPPCGNSYVSCQYEGEARMRNIDQDHIRKELIRLSKMARSLRMKELAHFIDVAGEVASEMTTRAPEGPQATQH